MIDFKAYKEMISYYTESINTDKSIAPCFNSGVKIKSAIVLAEFWFVKHQNRDKTV